MAVFNVDYKGRQWTLDTDEITTKELEQVERVTGIPGVGFLETLVPRMADGGPIPTVTVVNEKGVEVEVADPKIKETDLRIDVPSSVLSALWWLFQRHAGTDPGPIDQADVAYVPFLTAVVVAVAQNALDAVTPDGDDADPKATSTPSSTGDDGTSTGPTSPSFA